MAALEPDYRTLWWEYVTRSSRESGAGRDRAYQAWDDVQSALETGSVSAWLLVMEVLLAAPDETTRWMHGVDLVEDFLSARAARVRESSEAGPLAAPTEVALVATVHTLILPPWSEALTDFLRSAGNP
jgi:hypothetical protein